MSLLPTIIVSLALSGAALAQDGDASDTHHAPPPDLGTEETVESDLEAPPPAAAPVGATARPMDDGRFDALMAFRNQHLDIRGYTRWRGGGATVLHGGWGRRRGWGLGTSHVIRQPREPDHDWAVFHGPRRLDIPSYLEVIGDTARLTALRQDLGRAQRAASISYGVAGLGLATAVVGFFGSAWAEDDDMLLTWNVVAGAGLCTTLGGAIVGGSASNKAQRLQLDFRGTVGLEDAQQQVDAHNDRLRQDLGLSKSDVYGILTERPPRGQRP